MKKRGTLGIVLLFSVLVAHAAMKKTKDLAEAAKFGTAGLYHFALGTTKAALGGCVAKNPEIFVGQQAGQTMKKLCLERAAVGFLNMETVEDFKNGKKYLAHAGKKLSDACKKEKEKKD